MHLACAAFVIEKKKKKKKNIYFMFTFHDCVHAPAYLIYYALQDQFDCNIINVVCFQGIPQLSLSKSVKAGRSFPKT